MESALPPSRQMAVLSLIAALLVIIGPIVLMGDSSWMLAFPLSTVVIFGYFHYAGGVRRISGLWPPGRWWKTVITAVTYGVGLFVLFKLLLEPGLELAFASDRDLGRLDEIRGSRQRLLEMLLIVWVTAAFYEELFYRAFLIRVIAHICGGQNWGWWIGVVCSVALFGLAHGYQGVVGVIVTALGGLALSLIYLRHRDNLWIPIVAHGLFDSGTLVLAYLGAYDDVVHWLV